MGSGLQGDDGMGDDEILKADTSLSDGIKDLNELIGQVLNVSCLHLENIIAAQEKQVRDLS